MNLFIDTLSPNNCLILFIDHTKIIDEFFFDIRWNESTQLIEKANIFLEKNNISYFDLENIVFVNGPGSFTGVRTTTLFVNSINFIIHKNITTLTYFDLFPSFPIIKTSSKKDSFVQIDKNTPIQIVSNEDIPSLLSDEIIYWDAFFLKEWWKQVFDNVNYKEVIQNLSFQNQKIATAFYIKKPNIS